jgi:hypothetical protein
LIVAGILFLAGCACFYFYWRDSDSAKREKTTVGIVTYVSGGKSASVYYRFKIDGVVLNGGGDACRTALTSKGCAVGAPVLVYFDHNPALVTRLEDFRDASYHDWFTGFGMVFGGLLITVMHFLSRSKLYGLDSQDEEEDSSEGPAEVLHITPNN